MELPYASSIDWSTIGNIVQALGTLAGAFAVIYAAWRGSQTFEIWHRQKLEERRIEQAERILTATYRARRALSHVRSPMMVPYEFAEAEAAVQSITSETIDSQRKKIYIETQVYYNRLSAVKDDRILLEECQPLARALFGEDLEKAIEELNLQFRIVHTYVTFRRNVIDGMDSILHQKIDAAMYESAPSKDGSNEMDDTISKQISLIESICTPALRMSQKR